MWRHFYVFIYICKSISKSNIYIINFSVTHLSLGVLLTKRARTVSASGTLHRIHVSTGKTSAGLPACSSVCLSVWPDFLSSFQHYSLLLFDMTVAALATICCFCRLKLMILCKTQCRRVMLRMCIINWNRLQIDVSIVFLRFVEFFIF